MLLRIGFVLAGYPHDLRPSKQAEAIAKALGKAVPVKWPFCIVRVVCDLFGTDFWNPFGTYLITI